MKTVPLYLGLEIYSVLSLTRGTVYAIGSDIIQIRARQGLRAYSRGYVDHWFRTGKTDEHVKCTPIDRTVADKR